MTEDTGPLTPSLKFTDETIQVPKVVKVAIEVLDAVEIERAIREYLRKKYSLYGADVIEIEEKPWCKLDLTTIKITRTS